MHRKDKLDLYRKKRDFSVTPEPSGGAAPSSGGNRFVVQMHAARRLHFDLRLEIDGVYKSWAVTRGPSLDPSDRRLAVEVEDHPVEYGTFEGTIPKGEYGGGTVMLWDRGHWIPEMDPAKALKKGHIALEFQGERLKGKFDLVRMADRDDGKGGKARHNWLLIKKKDRWAKPGHGDAALTNATSVKTGRTMRQIAEGDGPVWDSTRTKEAMKKNVAAMEAEEAGKPGKLPAFIEPELSTMADAPPGGVNWIHEIKFDGYRMGARIENGAVKLFTRTGLDWTHKFQAVAKGLAKTRSSPPGSTARSWCPTRTASAASRCCSAPCRTAMMGRWCSTCSTCPISTDGICARCRWSSASRSCVMLCSRRRAAARWPTASTTRRTARPSSRPPATWGWRV
jgi:bifunctional non-homologous end joining protein LigD